MKWDENIQKGDKGEHIRRIQYFLRDKELYMDEVDGIFGPNMEDAVRDYQTIEELPISGVIGNWNLTRMLSQKLYLLGGNSPGKLATIDVGNVVQPEHGDQYPPKPPFRSLTGNKQRARIFGAYEYRHDPLPDNPENIRILGNWEGQNIVSVNLPELEEVSNGKFKRMRVHQKTAAPLKALWWEWGQKNLLDRIQTYSGAFVPRFIRGSRKTLSNHAFGSAFDINASWNWLGQVPAMLGEEGCVRELVTTAHKYGFYWGGHFSRRDGMHFEQAILVKEDHYLDIDYSNMTYERRSI